MNNSTVIALLTDFGLQDSYVSIIKGTIACINPYLNIIDIVHNIPPQNVAAGRFCLMNAYPFFPDGTVYVAVVDPEVGSQRRGVAIQCPQGYLVGPDNGLFGGVLSLSKATAAVELTNPNYWRVRQPSLTFHGRDIFASVGAHLASGLSLSALGPPISLDSLIELPLKEVMVTASHIHGCIQYVDNFGNIITNISEKLVKDHNWSVEIAKQRIKTALTYSEVAQEELVSFIGSHGWVEIAMNGSSAQQKLKVNLGDQVNISIG
ncbi:SAM hydrolase/SAM-dependent halogenase family protein [Cyanobacterium sp. uoEpiScrs1]|uniref:SAM hydrolase/SAM-dependent halogenase family protein n=1 Tax=Cyanobacterium sp. uoEpiScrs1 TaxID=2976343 RepID=UPI002269A03F|nr:SAM-dependent chlorinase/fluorinase [Cyanobacterium sp. uoEpiScrs1]